MAFKTNSSKASEGSSIKPEGDYEVIIDKAEIEDYTKKDNTTIRRIKFRYTVRNDVDQRYKNACIFHEMYKVGADKITDDDREVEGFNFKMLMAISGAAKIPDDKEFENVSAFLAELVGKPVKVHLYHNLYNGKIKEKIDKHYPTDFPKVAHKAKAPAPSNTYAAPPAQSFAASSAAADVSDDDDYPF